MNDYSLTICSCVCIRYSFSAFHCFVILPFSELAYDFLSQTSTPPSLPGTPPLFFSPCFLPLLLPFCSSSLVSPPFRPPPGRLGLAASYLSVKALVPQMPKLLKSLFPARDDKKELRPSPPGQQVSTDAATNSIHFHNIPCRNTMK